MKILVVDNEPGIRRNIQRILRDHEVVTASSAVDACKTMLDTTGFDLVLSNVGMSGGTGVDLHRWVVEHRPGLATRFAFMTGGMQNEVAEYIREAGSPILAKPFTIDEVKEVLAGFDF